MSLDIVKMSVGSYYSDTAIITVPTSHHHSPRPISKGNVMSAVCRPDNHFTHTQCEREQVRCTDYSKTMAFPLVSYKQYECVCVVFFGGTCWLNVKCQIRTGLVYMFTPLTFCASTLFLFSSQLIRHFFIMKALWNQEAVIRLQSIKAYNLKRPVF